MSNLTTAVIIWSSGTDVLNTVDCIRCDMTTVKINKNYRNVFEVKQTTDVFLLYFNLKTIIIMCLKQNWLQTYLLYFSGKAGSICCEN